MMARQRGHEKVGHELAACVDATYTEALRRDIGRERDPEGRVCLRVVLVHTLIRQQVLHKSIHSSTWVFQGVKFREQPSRAVGAVVVVIVIISRWLAVALRVHEIYGHGEEPARMTLVLYMLLRSRSVALGI